MKEISLFTKQTSYNAVVDGPYRYELRVTWDEKKPSLISVGLNPPGGDDFAPCTIVSVLTGYARRHHFGGVIFLNLFAWKATEPKHLFAALARGENIVGEYNDFQRLRARIETNYGHEFNNTVVACWGKHGKQRGAFFLQHLGKDYVTAYVKVFGLNRDGSPVHPLHRNLKPIAECLWPIYR